MEEESLTGIIDGERERERMRPCFFNVTVI